nr:tetratricopeptide repeat protein [Streptomyces sp. AJS327]
MEPASASSPLPADSPAGTVAATGSPVPPVPAPEPRTGEAANRPAPSGPTASGTPTAPAARVHAPPAERPGSPARPPADFLGRRRELRQLATDIEHAGLDTLAGRPSPHSRVLLIAGVPGSGRTTLAEAFVRGVADRYPDGVLRARLTDPHGEPVPVEQAAREILATLDGPRVPPGAGEEELTEAVRTALTGRAAVLFLDDVADPAHLLDLLPDSRECLVVAVSSGPLTGVPDVRPCALGGLDRASAVELLARRAGSAPRITVDPRGAELLAEACGDLPAALALTGGWLSAHPTASVADAARALARPGTAPSGEPGTRTPLTRAFRLAYDALPAPTARLARLLTLAPGGVADAHGASALAGCAVPEAIAILTDLERLGLLRALPPDRYAVPGCLDPLLRAELAERERESEALLARARMLERMVRQLQACRAVTEPAGSPARERLAAQPRPLRFESPAEARDWLTARRPALLTAVRSAVEEGGELDSLARRMVSALARALEAHRTPEESAPDVYRLHELVLRVAARGGPAREEAAALLNLGDLDAHAERLPEALARYRAALDAARAARDELAACRALESIGDTHAEQEDWSRAADWYGRALAGRQARGGDGAAAARLHGRLGAVLGRSGRWGEALREWRAAAALLRRLGDTWAWARALAEVAEAQDRAGRPKEALRAWEQALSAAERAGDPRLEGHVNLRLAGALERVGERRAARERGRAGQRLLDRAAAEGAVRSPENGTTATGV